MPGRVGRDSSPEISFIGKREKSEGKPPRVPNMKTRTREMLDYSATGRISAVSASVIALRRCLYMCE
jgi:hypothetical protein